MMMDSHDTFLILDPSRVEITVPNEVPRSTGSPVVPPQDINPSGHARACGSNASPVTHPAQATMAAPGARSIVAGSHPHEKTSSGLSSRKGPDLGGSKVVGVTETAARTSKDTAEDNLRTKEGSGKTPYEPPSRPAATTEMQPSESQLHLTDPDFWTQEARSLQNLLQKQALRHPLFQLPTAPSAQTLHVMFDDWLAKRPDLPRLVSPATSGIYFWENEALKTKMTMGLISTMLHDAIYAKDENQLNASVGYLASDHPITEATTMMMDGIENILLGPTYPPLQWQ